MVTQVEQNLQQGDGARKAKRKRAKEEHSHSNGWSQKVKEMEDIFYEFMETMSKRFQLVRPTQQGNKMAIKSLASSGRNYSAE